MKRTAISPARAAMRRLCTLLGLILAVMLSVTLYTQSILSQYSLTHINQITGAHLNLSGIRLPELNFGGLFSSLGSDKIGGFGSGITNILLIGQDRREGEDRARSDSMILCTYNKESKQLTMTSFLRDLYVPIPGHGENRINAAYALGGMDLLKDTLKRNFSLHIDGCVEVDFSQFSQIIDLLGGVELNLRQDEADFINKETSSSLTEGRQRLNGQQALTYSRIRSLDGDGDFSRTGRQRKVLSSLLSVFKDADMPTLMDLTEEMLPMITTDMSSPRLLALAVELLPALSGSEMVSQHIPAEGTYESQTINGMAVLTADTDAITELLRQTLLETD